MDKAAKIKELRESTGMNRKEFCEYFKIPYRTMSEWERAGRHAPDYLIRLLDYYIQVEMLKNDRKEAADDNFDRSQDDRNNQQEGNRL